jgi:hypothetical protein
MQQTCFPSIPRSQAWTAWCTRLEDIAVMQKVGRDLLCFFTWKKGSGERGVGFSGPVHPFL